MATLVVAATDVLRTVVPILAAIVGAVAARLLQIFPRRRRERMARKKPPPTSGPRKRSIVARLSTSWVSAIIVGVIAGVLTHLLVSSIWPPPDGTPPPPPPPPTPAITWLRPGPGEEVGWTATVELRSPTPTQKVTLLVQRSSGTMYYRQDGARP